MIIKKSVIREAEAALNSWTKGKSDDRDGGNRLAFAMDNLLNEILNKGPNTDQHNDDDEREALARVIWNADNLDRAVLADCRRIADAVITWRNRHRGPIIIQPTQIVACPHWSPGEITMRTGCTACSADGAR